MKLRGLVKDISLKENSSFVKTKRTKWENMRRTTIQVKILQKHSPNEVERVGKQGITVVNDEGRRIGEKVDTTNKFYYQKTDEMCLILCCLDSWEYTISSHLYVDYRC